jgi:D-sedoheptulose 7-phosphate isomerase
MKQNDWREQVHRQLMESAEVKRLISESCTDSIIAAAELIADCFRAGGKLMLCGNGGSAADCQHLAAELVGRLIPKREKIPMAAIALSTNTSSLTAIGNDYGFEHIFARQVEAMGKAGDVLIGISTSGKSKNIVKAVRVAKELGIKTIGFSGQTGALKEIADLAIMVPSDNIQRIQEGHITIGHLICELAEQMISPKQ